MVDKMSGEKEGKCRIVIDAPDAVSRVKMAGIIDSRKIVLIGYTAGKHA